MSDRVLAYLEASERACRGFCRGDAARCIESAATLLSGTLRSGGRVFACGKGGSAADAQGFAAELIGRFDCVRRPFAVSALTGDATALTAIANDFGFSEIFARQVAALGQSGDALVVFTGSGRSENVLRATRTARSMAMGIVAFTGPGSTPLDADVDVVIRGVGANTSFVQQAHLIGYHALCGEVERQLVTEEETQ